MKRGRQSASPFREVTLKDAGGKRARAPPILPHSGYLGPGSTSLYWRAARHYQSPCSVIEPVVLVPSNVIALGQLHGHAHAAVALAQLAQLVGGRHEAGAARGREHTAEALSWHGASPLTTRLAQSAAVGVERGSSCAEAAADLAGAEARQAGAAAAAAAAEAGVARRSGGARSSSNDSEISSEMAELDLPVRFSQFGIAQSCTKDRSTAPSGARPPARRAGPGPPPAGPARPPSMPIGGGQSNMGTGSRP